MRVLIPMLSGAGVLDGVGRHAAHLVRCLLVLKEIEGIDLVVGSWQAEFVRALVGGGDPRLTVLEAETGRSMFARNRWYYDRLPQVARERGSDLVHATYPVPLQHGALPCPAAVTLHDLYPYDAAENFGYLKVLGHRLIVRQCLRAADAIACVSDSTLERLRALFPEYDEKAFRIYNCVESMALPEKSDEELGVNGSFVLSVAQHRQNKDLPLTLEVFRRLLDVRPGLRLVIVGRRGPETKMLERLLVRFGLRAKVKLLEGISEERLRWCYERAELLMATSRTEGFGLPVAEAMLAGCPVVCSDIAAFREIGEGCCSFVARGPGEVERFVRAVQTVLLKQRPSPAETPQLGRSTLARQYGLLYSGLVSGSPTACAAVLPLRGEKGRSL